MNATKCPKHETGGGPCYCTAVGASELKALLADIVALRDECRFAHSNMIQAADPNGDARLAYGVISDRLDALIKRHVG